ncbi:glycosyltransferase [Flavivirga amylovorans]|uniref:Glycosyltransferase n=1 Tax=Flavivirga amylovorans TaxID=870486 RepID=A0ABT8X1Y0_9FLAO|nr:glycosyltransferase [Flavivirga amylovorans]MDO5987946.1 glycosyltransferase [Flavivirga amylovorans]
MRLSIIIPVYNVEKYIARCIESLLNQDLHENEYEILIINDGSKDDSISIAKQFSDKHSNIIIYNKENGGVGSARNKGIDLAKGKYVYFIDPDDYLANNVLRLILDYSDTYELEILTFLSTGTSLFSLLESVSDRNKAYALNKMNGIDYIGNVGYKSEVWWYIINRDFLKKSGVKFIEGRWMEDAIFTTSLFIKTHFITQLPIDVHRHVKRVGSAMTSREPDHYLNVIYDNENAALVFNSLIESINNPSNKNSLCIKRLKARQQSFVFFMMIRILKSTIRLKQVKVIINNMSRIKAYPLTSFLGNDYNGIAYIVISNIFNVKFLYYFIFWMINPFFRKKTLL